MRPSPHIALVAAGAWPGQALACTLCESVQAAAVRARLLQPDLWANLGAILLPLALLAAILVMVARNPDGGGRVQ